MSKDEAWIESLYEEHYLDLNGMLDDSSESGLLDYGTVDVYINGSRVADDVDDYYEKFPAGTTYEIKDIKANDGSRYDGVYSGSLSGTISDSYVSVVLSFYTILSRSITFNANGGSGSMSSASVTSGSSYTLPACGFTPPTSSSRRGASTVQSMRRVQVLP